MHELRIGNRMILGEMCLNHFQDVEFVGLIEILLEALEIGEKRLPFEQMKL